MTITETYRRGAEDAQGIVIAGYGGGNVTIDETSENNLMLLINEWVKQEIMVVISSQVALEPADFICENGYRPIKAGAFSGAGLSMPEIQVQVSFPLGH